MAGPAAERWRSLVRGHLDEVRGLRGTDRAGSAAFWDQRAERFARQNTGTAGGDPFLARVRRWVRPGTVVVDAGCGAGRLALPLAAVAARVVAVDPSRRMLDILEAEAARLGIGNVTPVLGRWGEVAVPPADVAISAHVLPLVEDGAAFLEALDAAASRRVLVCHGTLDPLLETLWRHFHGRPRSPWPTYLDAVAVLREMGVAPRVEIVQRARGAGRAVDLAEVVEQMRDVLGLDDSAEVRAELAGLMGPWLRGGDGPRRPVARPRPMVILSWTPRRTARIS